MGIRSFLGPARVAVAGSILSAHRSRSPEHLPGSSPGPRFSGAEKEEGQEAEGACRRAGCCASGAIREFSGVVGLEAHEFAVFRAGKSADPGTIRQIR